MFPCLCIGKNISFGLKWHQKALINFKEYSDAVSVGLVTCLCIDSPVFESVCACLFMSVLFVHFTPAPNIVWLKTRSNFPHSRVPFLAWLARLLHGRQRGRKVDDNAAEKWTITRTKATHNADDFGNGLKSAGAFNHATGP